MPSIPVTTLVRILLVEDSLERAVWFKQTARVGRGPASKDCEFRFVWARSAGAAIGILKRDPGRVYAGILLDHDLTEQALTAADGLYNGKNVTASVIQYVDPTVPVLVHSSNVTEAPKMAQLLRKAGFMVEQVAYADLEAPRYQQWLNEVAEIAQEEMSNNPAAHYRARMRARERASRA